MGRYHRWNKSIKIKTNLLTILLCCLLAAVIVAVCFTNCIPNLMFTVLPQRGVETVTIHEQSDDRSATLSQEDVQILLPLLSKIRLTGESVRLRKAEIFNPMYTIRLNSGICLTVACYGDYYIVNGKGYEVKDAHQHHYSAIVRLYEEQSQNRTYFPREVQP